MVDHDAREGPRAQKGDTHVHMKFREKEKAAKLIKKQFVKERAVQRQNKEQEECLNRKQNAESKKIKSKEKGIGKASSSTCQHGVEESGASKQYIAEPKCEGAMVTKIEAELGTTSQARSSLDQDGDRHAIGPMVYRCDVRTIHI